MEAGGDEKEDNGMRERKRGRSKIKTERSRENKELIKEGSVLQTVCGAYRRRRETNGQRESKRAGMIAKQKGR